VEGKFGASITPESLAQANRFLREPLNRGKVVALAESLNSGAVILVDQIVFFHREEKHQPLMVPWNAIKVAYLESDFLEIVTRDNQRFLVPNSAYTRTLVQLEKFINEAVGVGPND
jgi:hypothetical protein